LAELRAERSNSTSKPTLPGSVKERQVPELGDVCVSSVRGGRITFVAVWRAFIPARTGGGIAASADRYRGKAFG
jgi:hypothetical protein